MRKERSCEKRIKQKQGENWVRMNERDLQLAKAMVDLEMDESVPKKTAVSKMQDKQQTFR